MKNLIFLFVFSLFSIGCVHLNRVNSSTSAEEITTLNKQIAQKQGEATFRDYSLTYGRFEV